MVTSPPARGNYGQDRPEVASSYRAERPQYGEAKWRYLAPESDDEPNHRRQPSATAPAGRHRPIYTVALAVLGLAVVATVLIFATDSPAPRLNHSASPPGHATPTTSTPASKAPTKSPKTKPSSHPTVHGPPTAIPTLRGPSVAVRQRAFLAELAAGPAPYRHYPVPARRLLRLGERECRLTGHLSLGGSWWDVIAESGQRHRRAIPAVQSEALVVAAHRTLCPAQATMPAVAVFTTDYQLLSAAIVHLPLRSPANVEDANYISALACATFQRTGRASSVAKGVVAAIRRNRLSIPGRDVWTATSDGIATMCARHLPAWMRYVRTGVLKANRLGRTTTRGSFRAGPQVEAILGLVVARSRG